MINVWESVDAAAEARQFCEIYDLHVPVLIDETGGLIDRLGVKGVPFNLVIDETGTVIGAGLTQPGELVDFLSERAMLATEDGEPSASPP